MAATLTRFVVHQHKTGRSHFDLRLIHGGILRSWSLLKEPPRRAGERRLAIERESFTADSMNRNLFEEEAFGPGMVSNWDEGEVTVAALSPRQLSLEFRGRRLTGNYELRRMLWYPGNRWILAKKRPAQAPEARSNLP